MYKIKLSLVVQLLSDLVVHKLLNLSESPQYLFKVRWQLSVLLNDGATSSEAVGAQSFS